MNRLRKLEREYFATGDIDLLPSIYRLRERHNIVPSEPISDNYFLAIMRGKTDIRVDNDFFKIFTPFKDKLIDTEDISMTWALGDYYESYGYSPLNFGLWKLAPGYSILGSWDNRLTPGEFDEKLREIAHFMKRFGFATLIREPDYDTEFPPEDFDEQYPEAFIFPITALQPNGEFEHRLGETVANEVEWGEANSKSPSMIFLVKKDNGLYMTHSCKVMGDGRLACAYGRYDMTREQGYISYITRILPLRSRRHAKWTYELIFE